MEGLVVSDPYMEVLKKIVKNQEEILKNLVEVDEKVNDLTEIVNNLNLDTDGFQSIDT